MPDKTDQSTTAEAEEYRRLAELAFGAARSTLNPNAAIAFHMAAFDYLAKAKALDQNPPNHPPPAS